MKLTSLLASSSLAALFALATTRPAHAGLAACNNINVEANTTCEVEPVGVDCTANCTPLKFQAACSAKLEVSCSGQCDISASAGCNVDCEADCKAQCQLDASAECDAQCSSSANKSQCQAACKASVTADCDASCKATPGSATCQAKCQASCSGSCHAEANAKCQIDCQNKSYASCEAELQGHCNVDCQTTGKGALICDNQYIDHGGNLDECIKAINSVVNVKVQYSSQGSCSGNTCQGSAEASASCTVARVLGSDTNAGGAYAAIAAGMMGLALRRRRNGRS
jgi:hypothetical protein